jgi:hypothetical protein
MDNAANNDTFAVALEVALEWRGISFPSRQRRIWSVTFLVHYLANFSCSYRCFPHIVNLSCKAILVIAAGLDPDQDAVKMLQGVIHHVSLLLVDLFSIFVSIFFDLDFLRRSAR